MKRTREFLAATGLAAAGFAVTVLAAMSITWPTASQSPNPLVRSRLVEISGTLRAVDAAHQVIKMEDGRSFVVPASVSLLDLKAGDHVMVSCEKDAVGGLQVKGVVKTK